MSPLIPCLWIAGLIHLIGVVVNLGAPRALAYGRNLAQLSPAVRFVFVCQAIWGTLLLGAFGLLCLLFPHELLAPTFLARFLCWFLTILWGARLLAQLFLYDPATRRRHPATFALFLTAFAFQATVFFLAALGFGR